MSDTRITIATVWLGGCSGCHMSFLDLDERLFDLAERAVITTSPITDLKEFTPVDVGIVEGTVVNEENLERVKDLRAKARILVAFGDCACYGGISAMRNLFDASKVLERAYLDTESTLIGDLPDAPEVPKLLPRCVPVQEVVKVDAVIPGCPPSADEIWYAITELLAGRVPVWDKTRLRYD